MHLTKLSRAHLVLAPTHWRPHSHRRSRKRVDQASLNRPCPSTKSQNLWMWSWLLRCSGVYACAGCDAWIAGLRLQSSPSPWPSPQATSPCCRQRGALRDRPFAKILPHPQVKTRYMARSPPTSTPPTRNIATCNIARREVAYIRMA